jgi:hypothetical protein
MGPISVRKFFYLLETAKNTYSKIVKIVLEIFSQFKNTWRIVNFQNNYTLMYIPVYTEPPDKFRW